MGEIRGRELWFLIQLIADELIVSIRWVEVERAGKQAGYGSQRTEVPYPWVK